MARDYSHVELVGMSDLEGTGNFRWMDAYDLWRARRRADGIERELPYPAEGYSNPLRAYRRVCQAAANADRSFSPNFIVGKQSATSTLLGTVIGVATIESLQPSPIHVAEPAMELSYWHARSDKQAEAIGNMVVGQLVTQAAEMTEGEGTAWMVTLTDDLLKEQVLRENGFEVRAAGPFDINDGVGDYRHLWARTIAQ